MLKLCVYVANLIVQFQRSACVQATWNGHSPSMGIIPHFTIETKRERNEWTKPSEILNDNSSTLFCDHCPLFLSIPIESNT